MWNAVKSIFLALCLLAPQLASAEDILLTLRLADESEHTFTRTDLENLQKREFSTKTLWTEGEVHFVGVSLSTLLSEFEVVGGAIKAQAANDYAIEIPVSDATKQGPMIAYLLNGKEMSRRDKGPLWIVYPYDANVKYQSEVYYARSIWQLDRIAIQN
jgi:hypothetical protein